MGQQRVPRWASSGAVTVFLGMLRMEAECGVRETWGQRPFPPPFITHQTRPHHYREERVEGVEAEERENFGVGEISS